MNWYYSQNGQQAGPADEKMVGELIESGVITKSTMVWSDGMADWVQAGQTPFSSRFPERSVPPPLHGMPSVNDWDRDAQKVYPSNPPKSPHLCWLNLLLVGLAQILFGQVPKGLVILAAAFLGIITGGVFFFMIATMAIIDAFMVGKALKAGQPVGKWQFFPSVR